jgi:hypothetical protein
MTAAATARGHHGLRSTIHVNEGPSRTAAAVAVIGSLRQSLLSYNYVQHLSWSYGKISSQYRSLPAGIGSHSSSLSSRGFNPDIVNSRRNSKSLNA